MYVVLLLPTHAITKTGRLTSTSETHYIQPQFWQLRITTAINLMITIERLTFLIPRVVTTLWVQIKWCRIIRLLNVLLYIMSIHCLSETIYTPSKGKLFTPLGSYCTRLMGFTFCHSLFGSVINCVIIGKVKQTTYTIIHLKRITETVLTVKD